MSPDTEHEKRARAAQRGRSVEDWGMIVALSIAASYGIAEVVIYVIVSTGVHPRVDAPFPWIIAALFAGCVLPKTLGRATAGKVWVAIADFISAKFGGRVPPPPPPPPAEQ